MSLLNSGALPCDENNEKKNEKNTERIEWLC
jgi:hypothetical protein